MWIDTSSLGELADPECVVNEVRRLQQIEVDWARRVIEARLHQSETKAWLENIGEADLPPAEHDVDSESINTPELDSLINPEDALEHRVQRNSGKPSVIPPKTDAWKYLSVFRYIFKSTVSSILKVFRSFRLVLFLRKLFY
ncbi:hypothetical protein AURDEDRAFT_168258 [Auricularia subglabra TFB-10046 SS5]|nr:hypothetical protein AURDEDRAFT_168258 [Auricularia subglabra TFB-10046 SS5]